MSEWYRLVQKRKTDAVKKKIRQASQVNPRLPESFGKQNLFAGVPRPFFGVPVHHY